MKKRVLEELNKAGSEEYETSWDEKGIPISKSKTQIKKGRSSRTKGANFELQVRKNLEQKNWIVDKWSNNVDLEAEKVIPAKRKFNPFKKVMTIGTGFPDFIAIQRIGEMFNIIGVEVKTNGILTKIEKQKCAFLLKQNIFNDIFIAKKGEKSIEYIDFKERYKKFL